MKLTPPQIEALKWLYKGERETGPRPDPAGRWIAGQIANRLIQLGLATEHWETPKRRYRWICITPVGRTIRERLP